VAKRMFELFTLKGGIKNHR